MILRYVKTDCKNVRIMILHNSKMSKPNAMADLIKKIKEKEKNEKPKPKP